MQSKFIVYLSLKKEAEEVLHKLEIEKEETFKIIEELNKNDYLEIQRIKEKHLKIIERFKENIKELNKSMIIYSN